MFVRDTECIFALCGLRCTTIPAGYFGFRNFVTATRTPCIHANGPWNNRKLRTRSAETNGLFL